MLTGRKLLLADDSLTIQKVVSLTFNDEAMEVRTVGSGAEALESLRESLPDIVLADVFMPEPNGYQLCERIKRDERTRHLPVVLLVGTFEPFNEAEARRVGADEVLTKPFQSIRDLVNKVGGLLGGSDEKNTDAERARAERHEDEATRDLSPFADAARAAAPDTQAAEAATNTPPADAFNDFDMDDATIQSTPAAAFDARAAHPTSAAALEINEEEQFSDRGETEEAFVLSDEDEAESPSQAHAATAAASSSAASAASGNSYAASSNAPAEAAPVAAASSASASTFSAHAARAAEADDALLDIGDIAPAHAHAAANSEADDFILDIGDEDSFEPVAAAPHAESAAPSAHAASVAEIDMHYAENAPLTTQALDVFAEPDVSTEPEASAESQASVEESEMWASPAVAVSAVEAAPLAEEAEELEVPEISESPALLFANEPAQEARGSESFAEQESDHRAAQDAPVWDGEPAAASIVAHAGGVAAVEASSASQPAEALASEASASAVGADASFVAASSESSRGANAASSLSPEVMDELVRRVVAQMSAEVVREIAWEVVPDLAERLIKQRLEEDKARTP
ncbi:MAG TPA: response regulator [Pyrinomonadaceae bacterium]|nr:response regulator [Pyrinomonadaceae bacterium]